MDGVQEGSQRLDQDRRQLHEQDPQLRRAAQLPDGSDEISQNSHPAHERHFSPTQLQGSCDSGDDCDQLSNRPEANRDEGEAVVFYQWPEAQY